MFEIKNRLGYCFGLTELQSKYLRGKDSTYSVGGPELRVSNKVLADAQHQLASLHGHLFALHTKIERGIDRHLHELLKYVQLCHTRCSNVLNTGWLRISAQRRITA